MAGALTGPYSPGGPGGPGRPKGSPNKRTLELQQRIQAYMLDQYGLEDYCPIIENLREIQNEDNGLSTAAKIDTRFRVAEFIYPRPKAVELTTPEPIDVRIDVVGQLLEALLGKLD